MHHDRAALDHDSFWGDSPRRRDRSRGDRSRGEPPRRRGFGTLTIGLLVLAIVTSSVAIAGTELPGHLPYLTQGAGSRRSQPVRLPTQRLDGRGNNLRHPEWGQAGTAYARVAPAAYADGISEPAAGPDVRYVSNRVFNDTHQNLFSERDVTQWVFTWGQFIDHTIGLRDEAGEQSDIPFTGDDPLEEFTNTLGAMPFTRSAATPGTGVDSPRQQTNTVSSYIDAWAVYGGSEERLEWLRDGPVDGDMSNNSALLMLPGDYLPRRDSRGDAGSAPTMGVDGALRGAPERAAVAGDVRANENIALQATQNLFAREHNRVVGLLPASLSEEQRFQIARRVVIAEQQYITYNEFLPAVGVRLPRYRGYRSDVNANLSNEFATVGYRAHSMIHGEIELEADAARYTPEQLAAFEAEGLELATSEDGAEVEIAVPLNRGFFNPDLVESLQLGPLLQGIGLEAQYNNDEMIDNQLRSVLFQIPVPDNPACLDGPELPACFQGVLDLGAIDVQRGRDHGMPSYNDLRAAYGLAPRTTFEAVTGEATAAFPEDPELTPGAEIDDPDALDFLALRDIDGNDVPLDSELAESDPVEADRRTPLAARLQAIYGTVDRLDAFVGMIAEPHVPGADFGELQLAIWARQFRALRDGDRFFYGNDPSLRAIARAYGIDYRRTLAEVIADNTDVPIEELADNVFFVAEEESAAPAAPAAPDDTAPVTPDPSDPTAAVPPTSAPVSAGRTDRSRPAGSRSTRRRRHA
jgi:Animal haem peroxidase